MGRVLVVGIHHGLLDSLIAGFDLREHEIAKCIGTADARIYLRHRVVDVIVASPDVAIGDGLALARESLAARHATRFIFLAASATPEDVIAALRTHVFACFTPPFSLVSIVEMLRAALSEPGGSDGIDVLSGLPHWLTVKASCHRLAAERLTRFMAEHQAALVGHADNLFMFGFREMLLNAIERGPGFVPWKNVEITAAKTARAIVYHFRDPDAGSDRTAPEHEAHESAREEILVHAERREPSHVGPSGFGILLAREIADELVHNERGNEVLLIKHLT